MSGDENASVRVWSGQERKEDAEENRMRDGWKSNVELLLAGWAPDT